MVSSVFYPPSLTLRLTSHAWVPGFQGPWANYQSLRATQPGQRASQPGLNFILLTSGPAVCLTPAIQGKLVKSSDKPKYKNQSSKPQHSIRGREGERVRETERQREGERMRGRERQRATETKREREKEKEKERKVREREFLNLKMARHQAQSPIQRYKRTVFLSAPLKIYIQSQSIILRCPLSNDLFFSLQSLKVAKFQHQRII